MDNVVLKGMAWNHLRGMGPALATAEAFRCEHPEVCIDWDTRPLGDFEAYPIERLSENYDLILFDHPFTGDAAMGTWLLPLDEWMAPGPLGEIQHQAMGRTFESYTLRGHQWGLPIDTASQVMAWAGTTPGDAKEAWMELWSWTQAEQPSKPQGLLLPGDPVHAYSLFLAIGHRIGGDLFWQESGIDGAIGREAWERLLRLWSASDELCGTWDPPTLLHHVGTTGQGFIPWVFGYVNYARLGYAKEPVRFQGLPEDFHDGGVGSVLGGVGIGVSARSSHRAEAVAYAAFLARPDIQSTVVLRAGGQPATQGVWNDPGGSPFFRNTAVTVARAWVRPTLPGYPRFQKLAAQLVRQGIDDRRGAAALVAELNRLYVNVVKEVEDE